MIVFDTSIAAIAFDQNAAVPIDPATGKPVSRCRERIDILLAALEQTRERVMLPTPVVAEYIVGAGPDRDKRLTEIVNNKSFIVAPFDLKAAIECALIEDGSKGNSLSPTETRAKIKFDRQIIAIAKARSARAMYTGDVKLGERAKACGIGVVFTWELPLPPPVQLQLVAAETESEKGAPPVAAVEAPKPTSAVAQVTQSPVPEPDNAREKVTAVAGQVSDGEGVLGGANSVRSGDAQAGAHQAAAQGAKGPSA